MKSEAPRIAIVILNWNGLEDTIECLESLRTITYPNYEVLVVDNGSEGNDVEVLRGKYGSYVHIIENGSNLGFAGGTNVGIRHALKLGSDYVLALNNDITVDRQFLNELVDVAEKQEGIGAVGPKFYDYYNPTKVQVPSMYWSVGDKPKEMGAIVGIAFLVKREVFEKVGLLDETFYPAYCEDRDFFGRLKENGYMIMCVPSSVVYHKLGASTKGDPDLRLYLMAKYRFLLLRRCRINGSCVKSINHFFACTVVDLVNILFAMIRRKSLRPALMFARGVVDGIIIFFRNPKERW